jgi:hypothetical protein
MRTSLRSLFLLVSLALVSLSATARAPQTLPAWIVGTYTSTEGETKAAFLHRVALVLADWAATTGTEACGPILTNGTGFYVQVITHKAQTECLISVADVGEWKQTGEGIHVHPTFEGNTIRVTDQDRAVYKALGDSEAASKSNRFMHAEGPGFSDNDYTGMPGYLVSAGHLFHQHGRGTSEDLGPI